jgi:hypothetical protein
MKIVKRENRHTHPSLHGSKVWPKKKVFETKVWPRPKKIVDKPDLVVEDLSATWKELTESELAKISINPDEENANAERQNETLPKVQGTQEINP